MPCYNAIIYKDLIIVERIISQRSCLNIQGSDIYLVYAMPACLLKLHASNFIHNEVLLCRKCPKLYREKDGTAVPVLLDSLGAVPRQILS